MSKSLLIKILAAGAIAAGFYGIWSYWSAHHPKKEKAPIPVEALVIEEKETLLWSQFSGKLKAIEYVDIRPRVSGAIQEILFKEGSIVKKGDPLFIIDPRPFEAAVQQAQAALLSAKTNAELAGIQLSRGKTLEKTAAVSKQEVDQRTNTLTVSQANIKAAEANLRTAQLNLDYAHIKAPIDGRISRAEITVGNMVEAGPNAPTLTNIVSISPIYAEFEIDENTYMEYIQRIGAEQEKPQEIPVELTLSETNTVFKGHVQTTDNRLDPATGTIRIRAMIGNPDGKLLSGMFANIRLQCFKPLNLIVVPDSVIHTDQTKKFVYVIDDQNKAIYREVKLGKSPSDGTHIIKEGLKSGERIVAKGGQNLRPGTLVEVKQ